MLKITVGNKKHTVKNEFEDVTLNELATAYKVLNTQDKVIKAYLTDGEMPNDEFKLIEFKIKWLSLFTTVPIEQLRLIPLHLLPDSLSLEWLYNETTKFMRAPESALDLKQFKHKGVTYKLIEPLTTISGTQMLLGNANFRQFMLSSQLSQMVEDNKANERCIESLIQLLAVLYSEDNDDDSDKMRKRAEEFKSVSALYGWSAYFFFVMLVLKYKDYFLSYTKGKLSSKMNQIKAIEEIGGHLSRITIGKFAPLKSLKREYSILKT